MAMFWFVIINSLLLQLPTERRRADVDKSRIHDAELSLCLPWRLKYAYIHCGSSDFYMNT